MILKWRKDIIKAKNKLGMFHFNQMAQLITFLIKKATKVRNQDYQNEAFPKNTC